MRHHRLYFLPLILAIAISMAMSSCYADQGNYEYHEVDAVVIDTTGTGLLAQYAITRFDQLDFEPVVIFNGQKVNVASDAPLDYMWTFYSETSGAGSSNTIDTLGYDRHLQATIIRPAGRYLAQLTVTNRNDGLRQFWRVPVAVSDAFDGGWMVFYESAEHPGASDIALVFNPWVKSDVTYNRCYPDLYRLTNGAPIPGHPIRCLDIAMSLQGHNAVGLCTDLTLVGVTDNAIEKIMDFDHFFNDVPTTIQPTWYSHQGTGVGSGNNAEVLINGNQIYTNTYFLSSTGDRDSRFGVPKFSNGTGTLAAWNSELADYLQYSIVVYDQTNHCFRYAAYQSAQMEAFGEQDLTLAAFDVNNTDMTFLMGDWGVGSDRSRPFDYLLMANGDNRYLAVANFSSSKPSDKNIGNALYPLTTLCADIDKATTMAASNVGSFIYYGAGKCVYNFAYDSGRPATVAWTAPSEGEEVTCVRMMKYYHASLYGNGTVPKADNLLHIATWNATTGKGHLYQYLVDPAGGDINQSLSYDYEIPGRVADMAWKFSMQ